MNTGKISRRHFLKKTTTLGAIMAISACDGLMVGPAKKPLERLGVQLYTLRKELDKDFAGTLKKVRELGYTELEFAGYHNQAFPDIIKIMADLGLSAPAAHLYLETIRDDTDTAIDIAHVLGHKSIIVPWLEPNQRQSVDQYRQLADDLNIAGEKFRAEGIQLGYHNHDFEFMQLNSIRPYDLLLQETDPNLVKMELDLYWIAKAGLDPIEYLAAHENRFTLCHLKDMDANGAMVDVGSGVINFAAIIPAAKKAGVKHYFVEHDETTTPFHALENSFKAISSLSV
jgi:sugar phosphate isomerase/epimerase